MAELDRAARAGHLLQFYALRLAKRIAGCDFSAVRPMDLVGAVRCPIMLIAARYETLHNDRGRSSIEDAIRSRRRTGDDVYVPREIEQMPTPVESAKDCEVRLKTFLKEMFA